MEILFILIEFFGEFLLQVFISFFFEGAVELGGHSLKRLEKSGTRAEWPGLRPPASLNLKNRNLSAGSLLW